MNRNGVYELRLDDSIGGISSIRILFFDPLKAWTCRLETPLSVVWVLEAMA